MSSSSGQPGSPSTAGSGDHEFVLEALQISATATREEVTVEGVLPIEPPDFLINSLGLSPLNKHRHDGSTVINDELGGVRFRHTFDLKR